MTLVRTPKTSFILVIPYRHLAHSSPSLLLWVAGPPSFSARHPNVHTSPQILALYPQAPPPSPRVTFSLLIQTSLFSSSSPRPFRAVPSFSSNPNSQEHAPVPASIPSRPTPRSGQAFPPSPPAPTAPPDARERPRSGLALTAEEPSGADPRDKAGRETRSSFPLGVQRRGSHFVVLCRLPRGPARGVGGVCCGHAPPGSVEEAGPGFPLLLPPLPRVLRDARLPNDVEPVGGEVFCCSRR